MTTASWSTRVRHDDNPTYQEWRDEFITKLGIMVTAGVLAADETNITPGAGARPAVNTEQGYAVYHLADSLHGTAPVYMRFGFGTSTNATGPRIQLTTGTSTNGSGVLGGTALATIADINSNQSQVTDTARQSYLCCVAGFIGLDWKIGAGAAEASFFICRTCDNNGAPTVTGALVRWGGGGVTAPTKHQAFRYASPAAAYTAQTLASTSTMGFSPCAPIATTVGADTQVFLGWTITPRVAPLFGVCGTMSSEVTPGSTFTATLVGTTARTFLSWTTNAGPFGPISANTAAGGLCISMLWE